MTPEEFESDLKRSLKIIEGCTNQPVIGFRAPRFNVTRQTLWLFEILERNGIKYDSSIFPLSLFSTYNSRTISLEPYKLTPYLWEFPLSCIRFGKIRLPCSGGIFFRAFPYGYTKLCIKRINNSNNPAIFYIHPWELDYQHPYINLPKMRQLRHYYNLKKTEARLERLLSDFEFTTVKNILKL
jgi:polysaccharide deacetylase family protein (PEP-CTERM system associated)